MQLRRISRALHYVCVLAFLGCGEGGPKSPDLLANEEAPPLDASAPGTNGDAATACAPTLASVQSTVFVPLCASAGCHVGKSAAAALDLTRADVSSVLVGASASSCAGQTLVTPGNPERSLLFTKLNGHVPAGCGEAMPIGSTGLKPALLDCVHGWIAGLTTADAGTPIDAGDAGACLSCGTASCLDVSSDPLHCGACDVVCPSGTTCASGQCRCPSGLTLCNGSCVDTKSDRNHCGSCTNSCGSSATCNAGTCACGAGLSACNGSCVELSTDPNNCQACNVKCAAGQLCTPTGCSSTASCGSLTLCSGACVDTSTSLTHCGSCTTVCAPGQACSAGKCVCPNGGSLCNGACVDTKTSNADCGSCGHVCPSGSSCSAGVCSCGGGKTLCGNSCIDTQSDANNCGGCGKVCGAGKSCVQGSCACAQGPVSFSQVSPILANNCANAGCHSGTAPKEGLNLTAAKAYAELVNVKAAECNDGRLLVPSSGTGQSYLLQKLSGQNLCSGTQMPKAGTSLAPGDLALIQAWVCNGAPP